MHEIFHVVERNLKIFLKSTCTRAADALVATVITMVFETDVIAGLRFTALVLIMQVLLYFKFHISKRNKII